MYRIPSAEENIFMEVPQKIPIYTFSATLGHNYIDSVLKSEEIEGDLIKREDVINHEGV